MDIPNYFYDLPQDIQSLINLINKERASNIIQNYWYSYINRKVIAINLITNLPKDVIFKENGNITKVFNPSNPFVIKTFEYCNKVLSGNEDYDWWTSKIIMLERGIIIQYNNIMNNNIMNNNIMNNNIMNNNIMNNNHKLCNELYNKFN